MPFIPSRSSVLILSALVLSGCQTMVQQPEQNAEAVHPTEINNESPATTIRAAVPEPQKKASRQTTAAVPDPTPVEDLWQLTRTRLNLDPELNQPRVQQQLKWYQKHPKYIHRTLTRAAPYYHYILQQTEQRGLPAELALLPIVESAYDPFAYSHGRAAGPWQFIPSTAKYFGLKKTWWYDGRRDIIESTDAALNYLEQLNKRFEGDWLLALAAYNAGGGTVSRAIRKNTEKGLKTDFWSLKLPKETQKYVPKLLAIAELIRHHDQYALTLPELPNTVYFEVVETESQIDLAWAAKLADMELDELYRLNPGFNRWATDPAGPHRLLIPVEKSTLLKTGLAETPPEKRLKWQRYTIRSGDSLLAIAKRFNTTVELLRTSNNLSGNRIRAGKTLLIPSASQQPEAYLLSEVQRQQSRQKSVQASAARTHYHRVQSGDSLWKLAQTYNVDVKSLARWNSMAPGDTLKLGTKLLVVSDSSSQYQAGDLRAKNRKIGYQVRSGDSLHKIAGRYNVAVNDILRWNKLNSAEYLQPGQQLTLYIDVRKAR